MPYPKISYQAVNTNIGPISKPSRVTPPRNQNINNSYLSTTKKNGRIKTTILTTVLIQPRPSSGKTQLRFNAKFDTSRAKALLSENVHNRFGSMGVVTYPRPVGIEDANGDQMNFMGDRDGISSENFIPRGIEESRNDKFTFLGVRGK